MQKTNFHDGAQIRPLASQFINQAVEDLGSNNAAVAVDALLWLTKDDFPVWAEAADLPDLNP